jgi:hypothetical protein
MANATTTPSAAPAALGWRTPVVILLCGCLISLVSFVWIGTLTGFGMLSAAINLPIVEQPVRRLAPATAG